MLPPGDGTSVARYPGVARTRRVSRLELEEDPAFQQWQWRAATVLWMALLAVMGATALGAFGNGPLARRTAGEAGSPFWVEYEGVIRHGASTHLVVNARPQPDGEVRFTIGRAALEDFQIERITPEPLSTSPGDDGIEYRFRTHGAGVSRIVLSLKPRALWRVESDITSPAGTLSLSHFILP